MQEAQSEKQRGCPLGHRFIAKKLERNYLIQELKDKATFVAP